MLDFVSIEFETVFNCINFFHLCLEEELIEEHSGKFEGDILLSDRQKNVFRSWTNRNGLNNLSMRWSNGVVPVHLAPNHTVEQLEFIDKALRTIESVSCVRFVPHTTEKDFISMTVSRLEME